MFGMKAERYLGLIRFTVRVGW